jgi:hypothetical protein
MPSPKDGSPGTIVPPAEATEAQDADNADPGQVETVKAGQQQTQSGKYGAVPGKPFKASSGSSSSSSSSEKSAQPKGWIEIELVDEDKKPVPGQKYRITLPDETVAEGTLDEKGMARVEGIEEGNCKVTFPDLDQSAWEPA